MSSNKYINSRVSYIDLVEGDRYFNNITGTFHKTKEAATNISDGVDVEVVDKSELVALSGLVEFSEMKNVVK